MGILNLIVMTSSGPICLRTIRTTIHERASYFGLEPWHPAGDSGLEYCWRVSFGRSGASLSDQETSMAEESPPGAQASAKPVEQQRVTYRYIDRPECTETFAD